MLRRLVRSPSPSDKSFTSLLNFLIGPKTDEETIIYMIKRTIKKLTRNITIICTDNAVAFSTRAKTISCDSAMYSVPNCLPSESLSSKGIIKTPETSL